MVLQIMFSVFGGLGIFLLGMRQMSNGLQAIAGESLRRIINLLTSNRVVAVIVGFVITGIIQSSSVTTVMVVGFVNAGLMTLVQAVGIVMGANVGTTVTGWIIAIKITKYALPMIAVGAFFNLFSKRESLQIWGQALYGLGMVFFGMVLMTDGFAPLKESQTVVMVLQKFGTAHLGNLLLTILVGMLVCMLIQSSSAFIGIVMAMASTGLLSFPTSVALVLAAEVGTTITAQLASIGTNVTAKRAARAHMLFNVLGVIVMIFIFSKYVHFIDTLVPENPDLVSGDGSKPYIMTHIAMAHTIFNVTMVVLLLPFVKQLAALAKFMVPGRGKEEKHLMVVDDLMLSTPSIAVEQARQETIMMGRTVRDMLSQGIGLYQMEKGRTTLAREIIKTEIEVDHIQRDLTVFLSKLTQTTLTSEESEEVRALVRIADELESIADYAENLAKYYIRSKAEGQTFTDEAKEDLKRVGRHVLEFYDFVLEALQKNDHTLLPETKTKGEIINQIADQVRDAHIQRFNDGYCNPMASIIFSDIVVALRRSKNHTVNVAEAIARKV
ncbi:MAG TPA: Na/Pi cotransporter family protein [bacterium]|nr:Na/Pi cotransporter family protein [bacterium]